MSDQSSLLKLDGKVAWVTGSGRGLGKATAKILANAGAKVVVNCKSNPAEAEGVVADILNAGGEAMAVIGDVACADEINRMASEIEANFGPVEVLVVNATPYQPVKEIEDYDWAEHEAMLDAFVKSPFLLTQRVLPFMKKRRDGRIINITSEVFHQGTPGYSAYVAAKGGQIGWSRSMAHELAGQGITVNTVAPGWIPVERHKNVDSESMSAYLKTIPLGRWGKPEDVAHSVAFFASDEASFLTGQTLMVNGGRTLM